MCSHTVSVQGPSYLHAATAASSGLKLTNNVVFMYVYQALGFSAMQMFSNSKDPLLSLRFGYNKQNNNVNMEGAVANFGNILVLSKLFL